MSEDRANLMWKCRLSSRRTYPFEKEIFSLVLLVYPLNPITPPCLKAFDIFILFTVGRLCLLSLKKWLGLSPPLAVAQVQDFAMAKGDFSFLLPPPFPRNYNMVIVCQ